MKSLQTNTGRSLTLSDAAVVDLAELLLERARRMNTEPPVLCKRIRDARENADLSQEEAARRLNLSLNAYRAYETFREPKPPRLRQIAKIFGLDEDYFLSAPVSSDEERLDR